jgi:hypothetical protein
MTKIHVIAFVRCKVCAEGYVIFLKIVLAFGRKFKACMAALMDLTSSKK